MTLQTPIPDAGRAYKTYASRLEKLDIFKMEDFLYHIPSRYDDFSLLSDIADLQPGEIVTLRGEVTEMKNEFTRRFKKIQRAVISDKTGTLEVVWFNQQYLTQYIHPGDRLSVSGRVETFGKKLVMQSPEYEVLNDSSGQNLHTGRLVPIYPETRGVSSKWLRRQVHMLLEDHADEIVEYLPEGITQEFSFYSLLHALKQVHFPASFEDAIKARERLSFDELFLLQLASIKRRQNWEKHLTGHPFKRIPYEPNIRTLRKSLPFELTEAQNTAVEDIFTDLSVDKPMNRLLQGDVGSGKTVVSAFGIYLAYLNGFQSVLMAPTEILAEQHYSTLKRLLSPLGVNVALVTGSKKLKLVSQTVTGNETRIEGRSRITSPKNETGIATDERSTNFNVLVGTHAVLQQNVTFDNLGLIVIDEQQRFGVEQRSIIREKGDNPHFLTMTATPIPRTVALTLYGDLDLSYLNQMPHGRKLIKTWLVPTEKRDGAYSWIRKQIKETDSQIFIICPFIEESENMQTVKAATVEFERLKREIFPDLKLGLLHGRMKAKEKNEVLDEFRNKVFDILVATPVVEVGIDIPNATVIMIEAAERFGLAQLHQLRGRVGRGEKQSYCLLFTEATSPKTIERLKAMETSHNGAELAELDLRLRGPGELYGTLQSGVRGLKIASFHDLPLIQKARDTAKTIYPQLKNYGELEKKVNEVTVKKVSPD
jgi:ATP-dependent DNA helicase RecG